MEATEALRRCTSATGSPISQVSTGHRFANALQAQLTKLLVCLLGGSELVPCARHASAVLVKIEVEDESGQAHANQRGQHSCNRTRFPEGSASSHHSLCFCSTNVNVLARHQRTQGLANFTIFLAPGFQDCPHHFQSLVHGLRSIA
eukprot:3940897-Rhodomonas_salina.4